MLRGKYQGEIMKQDELTHIFDEIVGGRNVEGWGIERTTLLHILYRWNDDMAWKRESPDGLWGKIPKLVDGNA